LDVNLKFHWGDILVKVSGEPLMMSNVEDGDPLRRIPYIKEIERAALSLLKEDPNNRERLKEILEDYASRYAREYHIRA